VTGRLSSGYVSGTGHRQSTRPAVPCYHCHRATIYCVAFTATRPTSCAYCPSTRRERRASAGARDRHSLAPLTVSSCVFQKDSCVYCECVVLVTRSLVMVTKRNVYKRVESTRVVTEWTDTQTDSAATAHSYYYFLKLPLGVKIPGLKTKFKN